MKRFGCLLALSIAGCADLETTSNYEAALSPVCNDDPATPAGCFRPGAESEGIMDIPGVDAWFDDAWSLCAEKSEVWLCRGSMPLPQNCTAIGGGQIPGLRTACCGAPVASCTPSSPPSPSPVECPAPLGDCYDSYCASTGKCSTTYAWHHLLSCDDAGGICGVKRVNGPILCGPIPYGPPPALVAEALD